MSERIPSHIRLERIEQNGERRSPGQHLFARLRLEWRYVFSLPALGTLGHVELHLLTLLQALETGRLDRRGVHKNIFAILTDDETVALSAVEPLYCSLFCHIEYWCSFQLIYAGEIRKYRRQGHSPQQPVCSRPLRSNALGHPTRRMHN